MRWMSSIPSRGNDRIFLFAIASRPTLEPTHPPIQWVSGAIIPGIKQPVHEADHSPPSSAELKSEWNYNLHSPNMSSWHGA